MKLVSRETEEAPSAASKSLRDSQRLTSAISVLRGAVRFDEVLERIPRAMSQAFGAAQAALYLLDEAENLLVRRHTSPQPACPEFLPAEVPITSAGEVLPAAVLTGRVQVSVAGTDRQDGTETLVAVPVLQFGEIVGVAAMHDTNGLNDAQGIVPLLEAFAAQAGQALERARLYTDRERARELTLLQAFSRSLIENLPIDSVLQRVGDGIVKGLDVDRVVVYLHEPESHRLKGPRAVVTSDGISCGDSAGEQLDIPLADPEEIFAATVRARRPIRAGDPGDDGAPLRINEGILSVLGTSSFIAAPMLARDRVMGVVTVDNSRRGTPFSFRMNLLREYTRQAGLAMERALAEEARSRSERRYREYLEESPDGIAESNLDGRILYCNESLARMLGYSREELISCGARWIDLLPDRRAQAWVEGPIESRDVPVKRKDGTIAHLNVSMRTCRAGDETVLLSIAHDATQQHEVENRMRILSSVVTCSPDAIVSIDPDGTVTSWNRAAEEMFGHKAEEMLGTSYRIMVPPERLEQYLNDIKGRVEKEGHIRGIETERMHKDGRRIPVSVTVTRLRANGGPDLGWAAVLRDITESKREERQRRLLSSITQQSTDAILSIDTDGTVTSWNRAAEEMFGYEASEIVGRSWLELAPSDREPEYLSALQDSSDPSKAMMIDSVARAADGKLLPVRLSASVLHSDEGTAMGWSVIFRDLTEQRNLAEISERLQQELCSRNKLEGIVGNSLVMEEVREWCRRVARFNSSVLLIGSSGTGKEIVANAIHYNSARRQKPFIKVNCAAIPEELLESELFGIEQNVATGVDSRIGRFEMADGGTLFLDEIGDMSLATQAKILRVLQEREFERVGGKRVIKVNVRIIAATNKDLEAEIKARRFRDDLFYRLNVIVITLPPLVERREDIDPLIDHFLEKFTRENGLPKKRIALSARMLLNEYVWPGNVRELEHCIERAVVMGEGEVITEADLPPSILIWKDQGGPASHAEPTTLHDILDQTERRAVARALERAGWVQSRAARMLGISERSMWYRVKKLELKPRR